MEKILALDLGTNSIGWVIRDTAYTNEQFRKYGVVTFNQGVGVEKNSEYSFAAQRTSKRSIRRLYQARKYKLWETLDALRKGGYCPISEESLNQWRWYKKDKGYFRKYPVDDLEFERWIKLDFNGDGQPDYISPYKLRQELINETLDFSKKQNKEKLGRALYHIAQHRAFKSSKKVNSGEEIIEQNIKIGAEGKRAGELEKKLELLGIVNWKTIGDAFAQAEIIYKEKKEGRIRNNLHTSVIRKDLQNEVSKIFEFQGIKFSDVFLNKKGKGVEINQSSIFWQRPLRSQKGTIGKCTLEPSKFRCPVSHPVFEEFRAWSFLNNIKYRLKDESDLDWKPLDLDTKRALFDEKFIGRQKANFDFIEIYNWLKKRNNHDNWILNYNYKTNVSACPVSGQLRAIFGEDWKTTKIPHIPNPNRNKKKNFYDIEDIWHVPFSSDDEDFVKEFATQKLNLDEKQTKKYLALWKSMPIDYGQLSIKAIKNILKFLRKGLIYTEATLLAKIPEVLGDDRWNENEELLMSSIKSVIEINRKKKVQYGIVNNLIAQYKSLPFTEKFAERDFNYKLSKSDINEILKTIEDVYGNVTWNSFQEEEREQLIRIITLEYQQFFKDPKRQFKKMPHLLDSMKEFLDENFELSTTQLNKLYHPSQIEIYPPAKRQIVDNRELLLLGSPKTGAFKNPMAMRALHEVRKLVNYLIMTDQIDEQTRIVVELSRELNDANKRWAYETYQRIRQDENNEFAIAIRELIKDTECSGIKVNPDNSDDIDKFRLWYDLIQGDGGVIGIDKGGEFVENMIIAKGKKGKSDVEEFEEFSENKFEKIKKAHYISLKKASDDVVKKYNLWKQQNCQCIYTGKTISLSQLFKDNEIDFEHTIPRSLSFDNSLENLTVCDADYNRKIKKNQIPTNLPNYEHDAMGYSAIKPRLEKWKIRVNNIEKHIEFWKSKSKRAGTKEEKDNAIRQKHLWQFELDYWRGKLQRFTMLEVKSGFRNSQLVDTQLITKYASHYLKTVFNKVEVQKGIVTASFRKIFGIQQLDERKDRWLHSHHAKDAIVLSLIPSVVMREKILKTWSELEEERKLLIGSEVIERSSITSNIDFLNEKLKKLVDECNLPNVNAVIEKVDNEIVINNRPNDKTLFPAKKRIRSRGKVVTVKDTSGKTIYQTNEIGKPVQLERNGKPVYKNNEFGRQLLDERGNKIPVYKPLEKWAKGDIIRGQLHEATFLGAIKLIKKDSTGKFIRNEEGKFEFDEIKYVVREALVFKKDNNSPGFKSLEDLENQIVDKPLFEQIKKQVEKIGNFKEALSTGIWMLSRNGEKVNKIRRVRIFVRSRNPICLKQQTNFSNTQLQILDNNGHKQSYWVANAERPYLAMYMKNNKYLPETYSLFDVAKRMTMNSNSSQKFEDLFEITREDGSVLAFTLKRGMKIIFLKEPVERTDVLPEYFSNTLYKIEGFEEDGRTTLKHHLVAGEPKKVKKILHEMGMPEAGATTINFENPIPLLRIRMHTKKADQFVYNFAIEGKHFDVYIDGEIKWLM